MLFRCGSLATGARPRAFFGEQGSLKPDGDTLDEGNWVNVDDRLGYAVVDSGRFRLVAAPGRPCIWRGDGTMYDTCRLEFVQAGPPAAGKTVSVSFQAGERINRFGIVSCPNQPKQETARLGRRLGRAGWHVAKDGVLALALDRYLVYANFSPRAESVLEGGEAVSLPAETAGWATRSLSSDVR